MTTLAISPSMPAPPRSFATIWLASALLPLPVLITVNPGHNNEISCLYLGLASAWLAIHVMTSRGSPRSRGELGSRLGRLYAALAANLALFILLALAAGVESGFPFPLMAALSVVPAMGLVPCLTLRISNPLSLIILAAIIEFSAKLAGCVLARFVYGPNFNLEGRIADDWSTARLMISTFWILGSSISLFALLAAFLTLPSATPGRTPPAASNAAPSPST